MIKTKARACTGKIAHHNREAAMAHRAELIRKGASPALLVVYTCPTVKPAQVRHFHVGHRIPERRK